jgi:acetoin utilization deacetylase AcuC-like enzyme
MAGRIAALRLPTVLVQEGGYLGDDLGRNLVHFLSGFEAGRA